MNIDILVIMTDCLSAYCTKDLKYPIGVYEKIVKYWKIVCIKWVNIHHIAYKYKIDKIITKITNCKLSCKKCIKL